MLQRVLLMSPSVVQRAEQPINSSAVAVVAVLVVDAIEKCILQFVQLVVKILKYLLNPETEDQFTAATVIPQIGANPAIIKGNIKAY